MRFNPAAMAACLMLCMPGSTVHAASDELPVLPLPNALRTETRAVAVPASTPAPGTSNQEVTGTIRFSDMGVSNGLKLTEQQLQSGVSFTLPADQVITDAHLHLGLQISETELADQNLQLILNGQPLGAIPLDRTQKNNGYWDLGIPASMIASRNNLSFQLKSGDDIINNDWSCQRPRTDRFNVTLLPASALNYRGLRLNVRKTLSSFPRPFFDAQQMNGADVTVAYPAHPDADLLTASAIVASQFGVFSTGQTASFNVKYDELPQGNGILFGKPGDRIGNQVIADQPGGTLQIIDNPLNPVYKLLVISGRNDTELRRAAWRLTQPALPEADKMQVESLKILPRSAYDAPRWVSTAQPVTLRSLQNEEGDLVARGVWHGENQLVFRTVPDLFMWDGYTVPLRINYSFARKNWLNDQKSFLDISLNGEYLKTLPVSKEGIFTPLMRLLGVENRQQNAVVNIDPRAMTGSNRLGFYFALKPQENAACAALADENIKSQIGGDSTLDFTRTWHFATLPNLTTFANAVFPFTRHADLSHSTILMPAQPDVAETELLLNIMVQAGNASGTAAHYLHIVTGTPTLDGGQQALHDSDLLVIGSLHNSTWLTHLLQDSPFNINGTTLSVNTPSLAKRLLGLLAGDGSRNDIDAASYLADTGAWRGLLSYRSPWNPQRVVVVATATDEQQLRQLPHDMTTPAFRHNVAGDITLLSDNAEVRSWRVGETFSVGDMPGYLKILWYASQHILYLALIVCLIAGIASPLLFNRLQRHARHRLQGSSRHE